jgi:hypothetical protein
MNPDLQLSIKDYRRNRNLKARLFRPSEFPQKRNLPAPHPKVMEFGLIGLFCLFFLSGCRQMDHPGETGSLKAGAAEIDITPPVGYRMAGYFDERIATGVHDPLQAKALVLQQGSTKLALVFCDLIGLSLHVTTDARALASQQTGIPFSNIVISATHSHTGPLFDDVRRYYFHRDAMAQYGKDPHEEIDYPTFLIERLVRVIVTAQAGLQPAELSFGIAHQEGLSFNRRYWMKNGKVVFNPGQLNPNIVRPAGPIDPDVAILLARLPNNTRPFAGAAVFAMHSDTVGGTLFSADYEFYVQQTLRQVFGSNYISAFGLGTCGDINHINVSRKEPTSGFPVAEGLGTALGKTILADAPELPRVKHPALASRSASLDIPLQQISPEQLAAGEAMIPRLSDTKIDFYVRVAAVKALDLGQRGSKIPMEVQVFQLDRDSAIVCLPGEIFVELGLAIKRASPYKHTVVMSICNDRPSYVPTRKAFAEGSYEVTNSRVEPGTGERLVATALDLLRQFKSP